MNFPGVIAGDEEMLARVAAAGPLRVDGHSPGVTGRAAGCLHRRRASSQITRRPVFRRRRRSAARGCGCSCARARPARTSSTLAPDDRRPRNRSGGVLHRRSRAGHAAGARARQRLRAAGRGERDLRDRGDPAGLHQPGALPRLASARQPRPRPSGRHPGVLRSSARGCPIASGRPEPLVARAGAIVPGAVPASPPPDLLRDTVNVGALPRRRRSRAGDRARDPRPGDRRREPQPDHDARGR